MNALFAGHSLGGAIAPHLGISTFMLGIIIAVLAVWSLVWKGTALWFAARNHQKKWFIVILILNTFGIVEIVYLLWFRRDKQEGVTTSLFNNPLPDEEVEEAEVLKVASTPKA